MGVTAFAALLAAAGPALAHTPVLHDESDVNPYVAPLAVDGTDAINFFGTALTATMRVPFTTGGMNLLRLLSYTAPASSGTYSIVTTGRAPARFLVSIGEEGSVFDGIERGTIATEEQVRNWYNTAP